MERQADASIVVTNSTQRPRSSDTVGEIAKALAKCQGEFPLVAMNAEVDFVGKKGRTHFGYASLSAYLEACLPITSKHGIAVVQPTWTEKSKTHVMTKLVHESGEWLETGTLIFDIKTDDPKVMGSLVTYARRYSLAPALGLSNRSDDDDANAASADLQRPVQMVKDDMKFVNRVFNALSVPQEQRRPMAERLAADQVKREIEAVGKAIKGYMDETTAKETVNAK